MVSGKWINWVRTEEAWSQQPINPEVPWSLGKFNSQTKKSLLIKLPIFPINHLINHLWTPEKSIKTWRTQFSVLVLHICETFKNYLEIFALLISLLIIVLIDWVVWFMKCQEMVKMLSSVKSDNLHIGKIKSDRFKRRLIVKTVTINYWFNLIINYSLDVCAVGESFSDTWWSVTLIWILIWSLWADKWLSSIDEM